ncbi:MAG: hypothetical protein JNK66_11705 [Chitinophagales bacterium]|nr:hypothetical protein [Chitinophagales bacterium]
MRSLIRGWASDVNKCRAVKYCDKDYSKSDIDQEIEDAEDNGYDCTRGSMAL